MKDEDRKLWTDRINDYRSSGLTAVKWAEDRSVSVHKLRYYIHNLIRKRKRIQTKNLKRLSGHLLCQQKQ